MLRRLDTGLFLFPAGLYKAPALAPRTAPSSPRFRGFAAREPSLFYDGIERNISMQVALSVVVPVKDEAGNVEPLVNEIVAAIAAENSCEIVFVDDGSADATAQTLKGLKASIPHLRVIQHGRNMGQSRAVRTGVVAARGEIIVVLDGDGQNDPADIPRLVAVFREADATNVALVQGQRARRQDSFKKKFASRVANGIRRKLLNDQASDVGCGLKAFRRDAFLALPYFDHMHRYMVALMMREGFEVRFVEVHHRPRLHGSSKYGVLDRAMAGIYDLFGVRWLQRRYRGAVKTEEL
jgi:glycosyltransferase involved in cell wall biosynthesis